MSYHAGKTVGCKHSRMKLLSQFTTNHSIILPINSLRPSDAYMRQLINHHWFKQWLAPGRRQAIFWTSAGILLIGPLGTNFSEISIRILVFSFTKMRLKVSSAKWRPFCLGLNVLMALGTCYESLAWNTDGSGMEDRLSGANPLP